MNATPRRWRSPAEMRRLRVRWLWIAAAASAALLLLSLLDRPVFLALYDAERAEQVRARDWYQMFRAVGYLPLWLLLGAAIMLHDRPWRSADPLRWRGALVITAAALTGLVAEVLKLIIGRQRPIGDGLADGAYVFRPLLGAFSDGSNLGMPSSHAAVAFGGACMVANLWPRVAPVVLLAAAGCGLTRLLSGAHFLTDVAVAGLVGYALSRALRPRGWG